MTGLIRGRRVGARNTASPMKPFFINMVQVFLPDESLSDWEAPIDVNRRDTFEMDLHMGGSTASISGHVTSSSTGSPVKSGSVFALRVPYYLRGSNAGIDGKGAFRIDVLNAGTYDLVVLAEKGIRHAPGIAVAEGQAIKDLHLEVSPSGRLKIDLGYDIREERENWVLMLQNTSQNIRLRENKVPRHAIELETGEWRIELTRGDETKASRTLEVIAGEISTTTFKATDYRAA